MKGVYASFYIRYDIKNVWGRVWRKLQITSEMMMWGLNQVKPVTGDKGTSPRLPSYFESADHLLLNDANISFLRPLVWPVHYLKVIFYNIEFLGATTGKMET